MTDYKKLQARCQRGETSLNAANNLLAELYGAMGALIAENERVNNAWHEMKRELDRIKASDH